MELHKHIATLLSIYPGLQLQLFNISLLISLQLSQLLEFPEHV